MSNQGVDCDSFCDLPQAVDLADTIICQILNDHNYATTTYATTIYDKGTNKDIRIVKTENIIKISTKKFEINFRYLIKDECLLIYPSNNQTDINSKFVYQFYFSDHTIFNKLNDLINKLFREQYTISRCRDASFYGSLVSVKS